MAADQGQQQGEPKGQSGKAHQRKTDVGIKQGLPNAAIGCQQRQRPHPPGPAHGGGSSQGSHPRHQPGRKAGAQQQCPQQGGQQQQQREGQALEHGEPMQPAGVKGIANQPLRQAEQQGQGQQLDRGQKPKAEPIGERRKAETEGLGRCRSGPPEAADPALQGQAQGQPQQRETNLQQPAAQQHPTPGKLLKPLPFHPEAGHQDQNCGKQGQPKGHADEQQEGRRRRSP